MLMAHKRSPLSVLTAAGKHPALVPGADKNRRRGKAILVSVRNDGIVSARAMGTLLITAFLLLKMSGLCVSLLLLLVLADVYVHQAAYYGHSIFLATSVEVLRAHLALLFCVWA